LFAMSIDILKGIFCCGSGVYWDRFAPMGSRYPTFSVCVSE
jgi:hypothetical protein